jgi:hypothetical protein
MMLFEEFFKKKKINLTALQQGEPDLYLEFKDHYEQMGEKSFDHTKKYWFNKLRRRYPLPPEIKSEKLRAENQIAEQTVSDTLTEPSPRDKAPDLEHTSPATAVPKLGFKPKFKQAAPTAEDTAKPQPDTNNTDVPATDAVTPSPPKVGFKPRFKAGVTSTQPAENTTENPKLEAEQVKQERDAGNTEAPAATPPKVGFKPRFKAGVTTTKATEESPETAKPATPQAEADKATDTTTPPKIGFKPRFKAGVTTTKPAEDVTSNVTPVAENAEIEKADTTIAPEPVAELPKLGFKPRFKAGVTNNKPEDATGPVSATTESTPATEAAAGADEPTVKLGFKPRFKAGLTTTKPTEETVKPQEQETVKEEPVARTEEQSTDEEHAPKPAYKPRFTPNMIKRKPPEEDL